MDELMKVGEASGLDKQHIKLAGLEVSEKRIDLIN